MLKVCLVLVDIDMGFSDSLVYWYHFRYFTSNNSILVLCISFLFSFWLLSFFSTFYLVGYWNGAFRRFKIRQNPENEMWRDISWTWHNFQIFVIVMIFIVFRFWLDSHFINLEIDWNTCCIFVNILGLGEKVTRHMVKMYQLMTRFNYLLNNIEKEEQIELSQKI